MAEKKRQPTIIKIKNIPLYIIHPKKDNMQKYFIIFIASAFAICNATPSLAQAKNALGFEYSILTRPQTPDNLVKYGLTYDQALSGSWGVETGLLAKTKYLLEENASMDFDQIPLIAKFYSNIVNIGLGLNANIYTGARSIDKNATFAGFDDFRNANIEAIVKLGHDFNLGETNWLFEPSLLFIHADDTFYIGLGAKLKFAFD